MSDSGCVANAGSTLLPKFSLKNDSTEVAWAISRAIDKAWHVGYCAARFPFAEFSVFGTKS